MTTKQHYRESYELTREVSLDSHGESSYLSSHDEDDSAALLAGKPDPRTQFSKWKIIAFIRSILRRARRKRRTRPRTQIRQRKPGFWNRGWPRKFLFFLYLFFGSIIAAIVVVGTFFPNYTTPPEHYINLRQEVEQSNRTGAGNPWNEKVFIAASLYDPGGSLAGGDWAQNVLNLIQILGPDNVYLSIYENDSGDAGMDALSKLEARVPCNHTLVAEEHMDLDTVPHVTLGDGSSRIKRIAYLAAVRNRALLPLDNSKVRFDKLLYLNDIMFNPIEAAQLLFSTNVDQSGRANYRAACAVDFINAFKFYDTYATRDLDGFSMGVPFFPWFSAGGGDGTLDDILEENDAVRVRSCWGGMVAFDAVFFQKPDAEIPMPFTAAADSPNNLTAPFKFRAEEDLYWDGSECCLIHADIQNPDSRNSGIYMNPYVRVAYDSRTLSWLWFTRRFEKLYVFIHFIADALVNLPHYNPRRHEVSWQRVSEYVWQGDRSSPDGGAFHKINRFAGNTGFCGTRKLQVMKLNMTSGGKPYEEIPMPPIIDA